MNSVGVCGLFFAYYCYSEVKALPCNGKTNLKKENNSMKIFLSNELQVQSSTLSNIEGIHNVRVTPNISKTRAKRQSGGGKFVDAAKMPQIKLVRLFLQMFKNIWDAAYIGGSHPFHPNVPKTVMQLYKQKIVEFFIPDIEESKGTL